MIEAKVIADSVAPSGSRLTTFVLKYPRFIHAEFMTHRVFSRNASSSRAIPVKKMVDDIEQEWAKPLVMHENCKGMQGKQQATPLVSQKAYDVWREAKDDAIKHARKLMDLNIHKQQVNRLLEPFMHISVVCSATEYDNFFALRNHHMAQPEIELLARFMIEEYQNSTPVEKVDGEWHLPFIEYSDRHELYMKYIEPSTYFVNKTLLPRSVARCARVSYNNHDGTSSTAEQDQQLYDRLLGSSPIHASPAEHQAMAVSDPSVQSGNFKGWIQYRKTLRNENITQYDPNDNFGLR